MSLHVPAAKHMYIYEEKVTSAFLLRPLSVKSLKSLVMLTYGLVGCEEDIGGLPRRDHHHVCFKRLQVVAISSNHCQCVIGNFEEVVVV